LIGFGIKSTEPFIILFAVSRAPAYLAHFAQSRATSAYPFRPGIKISEMTKSIFDFSSVDRASSPSAAWRTSYPAFVRTRDKFPVTFFIVYVAAAALRTADLH